MKQGENYLKERWVTIDVSPTAPLHGREKVIKTMEGSNARMELVEVTETNAQRL